MPNKVNFNYLKFRSIVAGQELGRGKVCELAGVNLSTFAKWWSGASRPDPENLYRVLVVCGYTSEQIANLRLVDFYPLV